MSDARHMMCVSVRGMGSTGREDALCLSASMCVFASGPRETAAVAGSAFENSVQKSHF